MKHLLFLWTGILFCMLPASGQVPYTIAGKITDEEGRPLPGASVLVTPGTHGGVTGEDGRYVLAGLQPGEYVLSASFIGYKRHTDTLYVNSNIRMDINLEPSLQNLEEVVIMGDYAETRRREEPLNLEVVNDEFLKHNPGSSLMKSLERLPGVSAISIGSGQSKPVIRGLSFNRIVVVENGIKHEGQQWGMDHGLEIDQYAIDQAEVIKGPSSMMYGSDALGGVIILNQTAVPDRNSWGGSADMTGRTNNNLLGGSLRFYGRKESLYAGVRASYTDYGDYRIPADSVDIYSYRAPLYRNFLRNTAGKEGVLHMEAGWAGREFSSRVFISRLENRNGFFANAHGLEPRRVDTELHDFSSRDIQFPYHHVNHWKAVNRSEWRTENFTLDMELGFQNNFRQEWSRYVTHGFMPAIFPDTLPFPADLERQFEKLSYSGNIRSTFRTKMKMKIVTGFQSEFQDNRIDGRDFIIPAFDQISSGAFLILKQDIAENSLISAGLRYDMGHLTTGAYRDWFPSPAEAGSDTTPVYIGRSDQLDRRFSNLTWTIGYNLNREQFALKANLGKSFRMPLAKELAANGVNYHHFSYEVGNPELSPETAYQLDAGLECHTRMFAIGLSPFLSLFPDYIYLNPGYEHDRLYGSGNQVFTYTQSKVIRYGGEIHAHYQPFRSLRVGMIGEYIYSKQLSGEKTGFGLPFSPPASLLLHLKYKRDRFWHFPEPYAELDVRLVAGQQRIVPPEEPTPGYQVIHLRTGSKIRFGKHYLSVNIQVQNLLNRKYLDHTSYYRLINIPEPGRDLTVNISIPFPGHLRNPTSNEQ